MPGVKGPVVSLGPYMRFDMNVYITLVQQFSALRFYTTLPQITDTGARGQPCRIISEQHEHVEQSLQKH